MPTQMLPITPAREALLRRYAAGDITWSALREHGFEDFLEVLAGLGELGLRQPVAPMEGPTLPARLRGRARVREARTLARE